MHLGDARAVAGDADEPHESLVARLRQRFDRAARAVCSVELVGLDEVVQLDEVDAVDTETFERPLELASCRRAVAFARLGGEEVLGAMVGEVRAQSNLGLAI